MSLAFAFTGQILPVVAVYHGSTFPDQAEGIPFPSELFSPNHDKLTHFWFFYIFPALLLLSYNGFVSVLPPLRIEDIQRVFYELDIEFVLHYAAYFAQWFFWGGFLHIVEDSLVGRVPGVFFFDKFGGTTFRISSSKEYLFVWLVSWAALSTRYIFSSDKFFLGF